MKNAIFIPKYNIWLSPNSEGYKLYSERKTEALHQHIEAVMKAAKKRGEMI